METHKSLLVTGPSRDSEALPIWFHNGKDIVLQAETKTGMEIACKTAGREGCGEGKEALRRTREQMGS